MPCRLGSKGVGRAAYRNPLLRLKGAPVRCPASHRACASAKNLYCTEPLRWG